MMQTATDGLSGLRLGIAGGGQLGRMLLAPCQAWGLYTRVLDPDDDAPARNQCTEFVQGDFRQADTLTQFAQGCDVLTVEIEQVSAEGLERAEAAGVAVHPSAAVLRLFQDKGLQKQFYFDNDIPTAPFVLTDGLAGARAHAGRFPAVVKLRTLGYDGKGVAVVDTPAQLPPHFDAPLVIEDKVDIAHEIAIIVARSTSGEVRAFPPVGMTFDPQANLVDTLYAPVSLPAALLHRADDLALRAAERAGVVGLLAVEFFLTHDNQVLVNEAAPRPHNSGHHTIEACHTSQYMQHLRAITGQPLGDPSLKAAAVMVNILGAPQGAGPARLVVDEPAASMTGLFVHWYGKTHTRPKRKMGHFTVTAPTLAEARAKAEVARQCIRVEVVD